MLLTYFLLYPFICRNFPYCLFFFFEIKYIGQESTVSKQPVLIFIRELYIL